jgi:MATE family multidrug resistance protein
MAGHLSADLAAIAVGVGLWIPIMLLFAGIMIATTPLVAEARGAKTPENIPTIARQSLWVAVILGIVAMLILQCMPFFCLVWCARKLITKAVSFYTRLVLVCLR